MDENYCSKCRKKLGSDVVHCAGLCNLSFHGGCASVEENICRSLLETPNLKWFCNGCLTGLSCFMQTKKEIEELKKLIEDKLDPSSSKNKIENKKSYAEATGEVLVIKPKMKQENKITKDAIKKTINPSKLEIGITEMKDLKEGGVLIRCESKTEVERMKSIVDKKLKRNYEIKLPQQRNPKIKIVGIEDEMTDDELFDAVKRQNCFLSKPEMIFNVKIIKKMKTRFFAIVEVDPDTYQEVIDRSRLSIGWSICRVYEYISLIRCYKCGEYDHMAANCEETTRCLLCGDENHKTENCRSAERKCCNCVATNRKFKLNLDVSHSTFDHDCPVYLKKVEIKRRMIKKPVLLSQQTKQNDK